MGDSPANKISGEKIWLDGEFVAWQDAQVHILTHTLHYGVGVFEGIRCYQADGGRSAIFRLDEHLKRLYDSAHINLLEIPYPIEEIREVMFETLRVNRLDDGYLRPLVFLGDGAMGLHPSDNAVRVSVIAWEWGKYLGEEGMERGIRAKVSSFSRHHVNAKMTLAKSCGDYVNSVLAKRDALASGFDEAIMLDTQGLVSEATGENIFAVRSGVLRTPPLQSVLEGITRSTVIQLARDRGLQVEEGPVTRDQLYVADEVFLTGTAAEVTPIREIDFRKIGNGTRGPITKTLQSDFFEVVSGKNKKYEGWLAYVGDAASS